MIYWDSSALLKLYLDEAGTDATLQLWSQRETGTTATISRVEVTAGLAAALRARRLDESRYTLHLKALSRHLHVLAVHPIDALMPRAAELASRHALRAADAIHLAAATSIAARIAAPLLLASFDRELNRAAKALGIRLAKFAPV